MGLLGTFCYHTFPFLLTLYFTRNDDSPTHEYLANPSLIKYSHSYLSLIVVDIHLKIIGTAKFPFSVYGAELHRDTLSTLYKRMNKFNVKCR